MFKKIYHFFRKIFVSAAVLAREEILEAAQMTDADWRRISAWVEDAEKTYGPKKGAVKLQYVLDRLRNFRSYLFKADGTPTVALQMVLNLAVLLLGKKRKK